MNLWPPFAFAGIRVLELDEAFRSARVVLRRRWWNGNYVGVHFGGSLFAMTDPFWMMLAMHRLGPAYVVWDKAAEIEFVKPGRRDVYARFELDDATVEAMRAEAANGQRQLRWFRTEVVDADGQVVARVRKQLHVRLKPEDS
ncbi:MAG: DUF4442 domain-containing protein [Xanthomonadales bacterium]|nr:DUF4442 domain-containing protein [Xanthomonadales bacterium]